MLAVGQEERGVVRADVDPISQEWYAQPGSDRLWIVAYEGIFLADMESCQPRASW